MQNITQICTQRSVGLGALLRHHAHLQAVGRYLAECLPAPLPEHVQVANVRQGVLYLHVDSSAWGSRVRFVIPHLLACCQQRRELKEISSIRLKVRPLSMIQQRPKNKPKLSRHNATLLSLNAELTEYAPLRSALLKLASNGI